MSTIWEVGAPDRKLLVRRRFAKQASSTGELEYDCSVDNTLATSTPIASAGSNLPSYRSITEALNDFAADGRVRCWMIIRQSSIDYDDTAVTPSFGSLDNVRMTGQQAGLGVTSPTRSITWLPNNTVSYGFESWAMENITVHLTYAGVSRSFTSSDFVMRECQLSFSLSLGATVTLGGQQFYAESCMFAVSHLLSATGVLTIGIGGTAHTACIDCEYLPGAGTGNPLGIILQGAASWANGAAHFSGAIRPDNSGSGTTPRLRITGYQVQFELAHSNSLRGIGGGNSLGPIELVSAIEFIGSLHSFQEVQVTSSSGILNVSCVTLAIDSSSVILAGPGDGNSSYINTITVAGSNFWMMSGRFRNLTAATSTGTVTCYCLGTMDFNDGPWNVRAYKTQSALAAQTETLRLRSLVANSEFFVAGTAKATEKPYTIDLGVTNTSVFFYGVTSYTAAGTNAAASTVHVRTEVSDTYADAHINDPTDAHDATAISVIPAGNVSSTDVGGAINELDAEKIDESDFTAKGDLLVGTGAGTHAALAVGPPGTSPVADPAAATGVKWATVASSGTVAKYEAVFGDGVSTDFPFSHGLASYGVNVSVFKAAGAGEEIIPIVEHTSSNVVTVRTTVAPAANELRIVVEG